MSDFPRGTLSASLLPPLVIFTKSLVGAPVSIYGTLTPNWPIPERLCLSPRHYGWRNDPRPFACPEGQDLLRSFDALATTGLTLPYQIRVSPRQLALHLQNLQGERWTALRAIRRWPFAVRSTLRLTFTPPSLHWACRGCDRRRLPFLATDYASESLPDSLPHEATPPHSQWSRLSSDYIGLGFVTLELTRDGCVSVDGTRVTSPTASPTPHVVVDGTSVYVTRPHSTEAYRFRFESGTWLVHLPPRS